MLFTVSLTVSHHSETCGMNTTLGVLRRASRKTCKHTDGALQSGYEYSSKWESCLSVSAFYLSAGLLWCLRTDRVESWQIQAVDRQLLQVMQEGRSQMGAQSRACGTGQEEARPIRSGLLKSRTGHTKWKKKLIRNHTLYSVYFML